MWVNLSLSAKQLGELYHMTAKASLLQILRSGNFKLAASRLVNGEHPYSAGKNYFASFTRSRYGAYHYRQNLEPSPNFGGWAILTVDGDALSENFKFVPVDYWQSRGERLDKYKEVEERLISDRPEIPIIKYIKRVDFIQFPNSTYLDDTGGRLTLEKINRPSIQEEYMGSIILQLKKHHIPYGFFSSSKDWARRRGEFSFVGNKKPFFPDTYQPDNRDREANKGLIVLMEAVSDKPYSELSKAAKDLCINAYRSPDREAKFLGSYMCFVKPVDGQEIQAPMMRRLIRTFKRRGFNTTREVAKFLGDKYEEAKKQKVA